jgi:hypothetical protein
MSDSRSAVVGAAGALIAFFLLAMAAACSRSDEAIPPNVSQKPFQAKDFGNAPSPSGKPDKATKRTEKGNRWFPLEAGIQAVRDGKVNVGDRRLTHRIVYTVTDVVRNINGVQATAILDQDFNGGELAEQAVDYVAEDRRGNIWYLGSYTEAYEGGQFVNATDAWLTGINGAKAGLLMKARPQRGMSYLEATVPGEGSAVSQVVRTGASECVPFKCYKDVIVIQEGTSGAEYKYYAPGVGGIRTEPRYSGGEQETEVLVNFTQLSPRGLAEISGEVLKLERHAREVVPDVFGRAPPAKRTG